MDARYQATRRADPRAPLTRKFRANVSTVHLLSFITRTHSPPVPRNPPSSWPTFYPQPFCRRLFRNSRLRKNARPPPLSLLSRPPVSLLTPVSRPIPTLSCSRAISLFLPLSVYLSFESHGYFSPTSVRAVNADFLNRPPLISFEKRTRKREGMNGEMLKAISVRDTWCS